MDHVNSITTSTKYKYPSYEHYEYIIREITKHEASNKGKKRNTGRTHLIKFLVYDVGTTSLMSTPS